MNPSCRQCKVRHVYGAGDRTDKIKHLLLWSLLISVLAAMLTASCSRVPSTSGTVFPTIFETPTPSPPALESPAISRWQDLYSLIGRNPAVIDNSNFPITPVESLGITAVPPDVDIATYTLSVDGLVDTPLVLSFGALLKYPAVSETVLLICPGNFADNAEWTGVRVTTLLTEAGVKPEASQVTFYAMDQYQRTFSLQDVQQDGLFLAHIVNGQQLPEAHGYPIRLVVKGRYGAEWVKWVDHIEVK